MQLRRPWRLAYPKTRRSPMAQERPLKSAHSAARPDRYETEFKPMWSVTRKKRVRTVAPARVRQRIRVFTSRKNELRYLAYVTWPKFLSAAVMLLVALSVPANNPLLYHLGPWLAFIYSCLVAYEATSTTLRHWRRAVSLRRRTPP